MGNLIYKIKMKFTILTALAGYASAQAPDCTGPGGDADICSEDTFGEGACCAELSVGELGQPDGNYGAFSEYIWKLPEGKAIEAGWTATLCVPKTYIDAHAAAIERAGTELIPATQNLGIVLDTVPGVREAF